MDQVLNSDLNELSHPDLEFMEHIENNLVISYKYDYHIAVSLLYYKNPTMGIKYILHILLSLGRFKTEIDLTTHEPLCECLRYANLINPSDEHDDLDKYSYNLLLMYI